MRWSWSSWRATTQRLPRQLSGGQQQRVALARAIVFNPRLLLLDEPFGALDRKLRETLQLEVRRLQQRLGLTTIFITHDQEEALVLSDRIAVMSKGAIQQIATRAEIYERPVNDFVADFVGESNIFHGVLSAQNTVTLDNGRVLQVKSDAAPGKRLGVLMRPERFSAVGRPTCSRARCWRRSIWAPRSSCDCAASPASNSSSGSPPAASFPRWASA